MPLVALLIAGISGLGAADKPGGPRGIRITFYETATEERRAEIIDMLMASGLVSDCTYEPGVTDDDVRAAFADE